MSSLHSVHSGVLSGFAANTEGASAEVSTDYARSGTRALKMMHPGGQNVSPGNRNARTHPTTVQDDLVYTTWYYMPTKLDGRTDGDYFFNNLMDWKVRYNDEPNGLYADVPWMSFNLGVRGGVGSGGNNYLQLAEIRQFSVPGGTTTVYDAGVDLPVGQWWGLRVEVRVDRAAGTAQVRGELNIGGAWQSISAWNRVLAYPATSYHGGTKWFEYWYIGNYGRNYQGPWNLYADDVAVHRVP